MVYLVCKGTKEAYKVLLVTENQHEAEMYGLAYGSVNKTDNIFLEEHGVVKEGIIDKVFTDSLGNIPHVYSGKQVGF